jgi:hypothetical protein
MPPRRNPVVEQNVKEKWEASIPGTVSVWTYSKRGDDYVKTQVGGRHSKYLYITTDDRHYNQELIPDENLHLDPFRNGTLRLVSNVVDADLDVRNHLTAGDLRAIVADRPGFPDRIRGMDNELILRRLLVATEEDGTVSQVELLKALLNERYPVIRPTAEERELALGVAV